MNEPRAATPATLPAADAWHPFMRPLPEPLRRLADLALDLRWTWSHVTDRLWETIDAMTWERTRNPWLVLQSAPRGRLDALATDAAFLGELSRLLAEREERLCGATWCSQTEPAAQHCTVAWFSMEYGLTEALPMYSGGLGVLAGDYLKTASDLGVPVVGVGLLYQEGYFRQAIDAAGEQLEFYPANVITHLPITPIAGSDGAPLVVRVELPGRDLVLQVWRAQVGRVPLYLLDSNHPLNSAADRGITSQLYGGGAEMRLLQEIALGIGGWRALMALGIHPTVCHLNEGHAALVALERARTFMTEHGVGFREALWATRAGNVFTTHTPVAAAFDTWPVALLARYGSDYVAQLDIPVGAVLALGRRNSHDPDESFNLAYLAARTSAWINGVSALHGEVSRRIFAPAYPRWPTAEVPVGHITNGVHVPTWDSPWADALWTASCGKGRWRGALDALPEVIRQIDDRTLWTVCSEERNHLVHYARRRHAQALAQRGATTAEVDAAARVLDPNVLTLGFARRFTAYKRPELLLHDADRLARILGHPDRPVQIIVAGKAHPFDGPGKHAIRAWARFFERPDVHGRAVLLEDYDLSLAQELVQGVDVWINTPRRPMEASGTSGMKVLVNGGLNLSVLDGWWAEAWAPDLGWAIGSGDSGPEEESIRDAAEAGQLYALLENEIVPMFYARDADGIPRAWTDRMRRSMAQLAPRFSSNRMLQQYVQEVYLHAASRYRERSAEGARLARALAEWEVRLRRGWPSIHIVRVAVGRGPDAWSFEVHAHLGDVDPDDVRVQLYADAYPDASPEHPGAVVEMDRGEPLPGTVNGFVWRASVPAVRPATHYTPRIIPHHAAARVPAECALIHWWEGQLA